MPWSHTSTTCFWCGSRSGTTSSWCVPVCSCEVLVETTNPLGMEVGWGCVWGWEWGWGWRQPDHTCSVCSRNLGTRVLHLQHDHSCSFEWACWRTGLLGYTPFEIPTINEHFVCYSVVQADVHMHGKIGASGLLSFQHMLSNVEFN